MVGTTEAKAAAKARAYQTKVRKSALTRFANGTLGLDKLIELSDQDQYKGVRKIKLVKLLSLERGWSQESVKRLLINNEFSVESTLGDARRRPKLMILCRHVVNNSAPDNTDLEEVKGWPWRGSILQAIDALPGGITLEELESARGKKNKSEDPVPKKTAAKPKKAEVDEAVIDSIIDDIDADGDELPDVNDGELDANQLYDMLGVNRG